MIFLGCLWLNRTSRPKAFQDYWSTFTVMESLIDIDIKTKLTIISKRYKLECEYTCLAMSIRFRFHSRFKKPSSEISGYKR